MLQLHSFSSERDQVVETMITLTHLSNLNRAIVAGQGSTSLYSLCGGAALSGLDSHRPFACAWRHAPSVSSPSRNQ
jgi:hypothetical protein